VVALLLLGDVRADRLPRHQPYRAPLATGAPGDDERDGGGLFTLSYVVVGQFTFANATFSGDFEALGPLVAVRELGGAVTWGWRRPSR
jgi:hypothetical protein